MDWLRAALNNSSDTDDEPEDDPETKGNKKDADESKNNEVPNLAKTPLPCSVDTPEDRNVITSDLSSPKVVTGSGDVKDSTMSDTSSHPSCDKNSSPNEGIDRPLFSIETGKRALQTFDAVKITVPTRVEVEEVKPKVSQMTRALVPKDNYSIIDYSEALQRFNVQNSGADVKLPKVREWNGADIRIVDVNAMDLRLSKEEKERAYSKEALMEERKVITIPSRALETDDGHILTSNAVRRTQKRKHHINWVAMEVQEREMDILEQTAHMRKTKHETQMKYGW